MPTTETDGGPRAVPASRDGAATLGRWLMHGGRTDGGRYSQLQSSDAPVSVG